MGPRHPLSTLALLCVLLAALLVGCGGDDEDPSGGDGGESEPSTESGDSESAEAESGGGDSADTETFEVDGFEITFEYPSDFELSENVSFNQSAGNAAAATAGVGLDNENVLAVQRYDLQIEVTDSNFEQVKAEADMVFSQLAGMQVSGTETDVAGLPALEYELELTEPEDASTRAIAIFDGDVEYLLNCQSTPENAEPIAEACDLALETLTPSDSAGSGDATAPAE